eukprot:1189244-Pleurochrysis_carterae.AAC.2
MRAPAHACLRVHRHTLTYADVRLRTGALVRSRACAACVRKRTSGYEHACVRLHRYKRLRALVAACPSALA